MFCSLRGAKKGISSWAIFDYIYDFNSSGFNQNIDDLKYKQVLHNTREECVTNYHWFLKILLDICIVLAAGKNITF